MPAIEFSDRPAKSQIPQLYCVISAACKESVPGLRICVTSIKEFYCMCVLKVAIVDDLQGSVNISIIDN